MSDPVFASQIRAVLSSLAVTTRVSSGLNRQLVTGRLCASGGLIGCPVYASQILAVVSPLAVTTDVPDGLKLAK